MEKIGMTGGAGFLGGLLLKRLSDVPSIREIHVFDVKPPEVPSSKFIFHRLDLTRDNADSTLAELLIKHEIKTFVHSALFSGPGRNKSAHRETESIGTFHILNAVAEAGIEKLLVHSDTFVYGAHPQHPNFLNEDTPLRLQGPHFVRARVDVEKQIQEFARDYRNVSVTVLRFASVLGPNSPNIRARYFLVGLVPKVMGYDPLLQFIHEDDAVRASLLALTHEARGVFNIVGRGVLPLSTGIHLSGKIPVPVATPICRKVFSLGFYLRLWDLPAEMVPFFQYLCVADGRKAEQMLNFKAQYSSRQALRAMIEADRLRNVGFAIPSSGLGEDESSTPDQGFERVY